MNAGVNKQFIRLNGVPVLIHTLRVFSSHPDIDFIVVVSPSDEIGLVKQMIDEYKISKVTMIVPGGVERQESVLNGLMAMDEADHVLVHDGARPFVSHSLISELIVKLDDAKGVIPIIPVKDTVKRISPNGEVLETLDRKSLWAVQTPQAFHLPILLKAHQQAKEDGFFGTDDAMLVERLGERVITVMGNYDNIKLTTPEDLNVAQGILNRERENDMFRIGQGFDVHQLVEGRRCIIGGVEIPHDKGLLGHSDADVLLHAIADAILGALGKGDIGKHFPDTDNSFKDADSMVLLGKVWSLTQQEGFELSNLDCTIIAQKPKMAPFIGAMIENISMVLKANPTQINVKATTTESLGFTGREEGIAAQAIVLLKRK
ncbi:2-C-methyl-D-erythritol 4-phosphate cytidylyltransferase [Microaerobacter geothermalis]|nr:2-C-methyl-D-erythritol 4-phosphate cytidylyltransferase [Microaerobacter geothermalis]